jgi:hypothetical protein
VGISEDPHPVSWTWILAVGVVVAFFDQGVKSTLRGADLRAVVAFAVTVVTAIVYRGWAARRAPDKANNAL